MTNLTLDEFIKTRKVPSDAELQNFVEHNEEIEEIYFVVSGDSVAEVDRNAQYFRDSTNLPKKTNEQFMSGITTALGHCYGGEYQKNLKNCLIDFELTINDKPSEAYVMLIGHVPTPDKTKFRDGNVNLIYKISEKFNRTSEIKRFFGDKRDVNYFEIVKNKKYELDTDVNLFSANPKNLIRLSFARIENIKQIQYEDVLIDYSNNPIGNVFYAK